MSHFTVAVITKDGDYEKALAPFDENIEVEKYIRTSREENIAECKRIREKYENTDNERDKQWYLNSDWSKIDFTNDETIIKSYIELFNYDDLDEQGNKWSTYNPKSKWDWYSLGGRWCGTLRLKQPVKTKQSEPSLIYLKENPKEILETLSDELKTDHAQVKDIDFTPDLTDIEHHKRFWEINVEDSPLKENEKAEDFRNFYRKNYYLEKYGDKETYIKEHTSFRTYAILYHGEWIEPGEMGWFGCSNANKDGYAQYREKFEEIISNLDPEDWISVVDCHI